MSLFWQRNVTFLLVTLGWVFFRSPDFAHAARWFAGLAGMHGIGTVSTPETLALLGLVAVCTAIVRLCPNSLELPLIAWARCRRRAWAPRARRRSC